MAIVIFALLPQQRRKVVCIEADSLEVLVSPSSLKATICIYWQMLSSSSSASSSSASQTWLAFNFVSVAVNFNYIYYNYYLLFILARHQWFYLFKWVHFFSLFTWFLFLIRIIYFWTILFICFVCCTTGLTARVNYSCK